MKRGKIKFLVVLLAVVSFCLCGMGLTACRKPITASLWIDESATLYVGETTQVTATAVNLDGEIIWESSDPETVRLTADGNTATLTARKAGMANVTVTCGGKSAICVVTVNAITEVIDVSVTYDNVAVPTFVKGDVLQFAKLSAQSASTSDFRYTVRYGDGEETALTADYTFAESGRYTVTAYVTARGFSGKGMLGITVAQPVTDIAVTYNASSAAQFVKGQTLEFSKLAATSQTVSSENLAYRLALPSGEKIALAADYTFAESGAYSVEAYVTGTAEYNGFGSLSVTVTDKQQATVSILYDDAAASETVEIDIDSLSGEWSKFSASPSGGSAVFTTRWKIDDGAYQTSASNLSISSVGNYTLTVHSESETHKGTASIALTVYKTHTVTWGATLPANVLTKDEIALNATASENKDCVYLAQYADGEWETFTGTFSKAGSVKVKAKVYSADGLHRGESAEKSATVYAVGTESDVSTGKGAISLVLNVKRKVGEDSDSGTYGNTATFDSTKDVTFTGSPASTVNWLVLDGTVASYSDNTATATAVGTTKLCAIIDGKAYPVCDVQVRDLTGYLAITSPREWLDKLPWEDSTSNYVVTEDLDFAGIRTWKRFNRNGDAGGLKHVLDGNGHALKNIVVPSGTDQAAFIGQVATGGVIRNFRFLNVRTSDTQTGKYYGLIGFLVGSAENIYAEITVPSGQMLTDGAAYQAEYCMGGLFGQFRGAGFRAENIMVALNGTTPDNLSRTGALAGATSQKIDANAGRIKNCYVVGKSKIPAIFSNGSSAAAQGNKYFGKFDTLAALQADKADLFTGSGAFTSVFWKNALRSPVLRYNMKFVNAPQESKYVSQTVTGTSVNISSIGFAQAESGDALSISYKSSNISVLTVDGTNHAFTPVGEGTAKVIATVDGIDVDLFTVTVVEYKGISTVADWNALPTANSTDNYLLLNDLDFNNQAVGAKFLRGGDGNFNNASGLKHVFDGNGYAIKNFTAVKTHPNNDEWRGLIGQVSQSGVVRNIKFLDVVGAATTGGTRTGGVISFLCGKAENIYAEVSINTTNSSYTSAGASSPENSVGGLIGILVNGTGATLKNVIVKATVNDSITDTKSIGGVLGAVGWETRADCVSNCYVITDKNIKAVAWVDVRQDKTNGYNAGVFGTDYSKENADFWATYETVEALKTAQSAKFASGGVFATDFWNGILSPAN